MIDLSIYPKFQRDTEGHVQTLEIMVVIGWNTTPNTMYHNYFGSPKHDAIFLAQEEKSWLHWSPNDSQWEDEILSLGRDIPIFWYDFGIDLPYFEEKVDILERKTSVNDITLTLNNFDKKDISGGFNHWGRDLGDVAYGFGRLQGNFQFTDILKIRPILNEKVAIFVKSPSASEWQDMVPIYLGVVTDIKQKTNNVQVILEDISDYRFKNEMPKNLIEGDNTVPEQHRGNPIPMQFGLIDNAPTVYSRIADWSDEYTAHQEVFHLDVELLHSELSNNITLHDGTELHQSFFNVYQEGYWNLSQQAGAGMLGTDEDTGEFIPVEDGSNLNFTINYNKNRILMVGSGHNELTVEYPEGSGITIPLSEVPYPECGTEFALLYELYLGQDEEGIEDDEYASEFPESDPVSLFNMKNDTVNGNLRIHAFSKPESVDAVVKSNNSNELHVLDVKSYASEGHHANGNHDGILDMKKCYNWLSSTLSPDTTSFVELTGNIVARYRYSRSYRSYHAPAFAVDFGNNGLPFNNFEEITDTSYYMKSSFQCTHPIQVAINKGENSAYSDQGDCNFHWRPALRRPVDMYNNPNNEIPAEGGIPNANAQVWHWNVDTIDGQLSSLVTNYGLELQLTDLFENTSQLVQADGEIFIGPMEPCLRRNFPHHNGHGYYGESLTYTGVFNGEEYTTPDRKKGLGCPFTFRLYNIAAFSTYLVKRDPKFTYYAHIKGRTGEAVERHSGDQYLRKPSDILLNILRTEYNLHGSSLIDYNGLDLSRARSEHSHWHLDFAITEQNEGKKIIQDIALSSKLVPTFNSAGKFRLNSIQNKYLWEDVIEVDSGDVIKYDFERTPLRDIYTNVVLHYHYDYGSGKLLKTLEKNISELNYPMVAYFGDEDNPVQSDYNPAFYGALNTDSLTLTVDSDFIRSDDIKKQYISDSDVYSYDATAHKYVDFLLAFHCNQHTILKISLPLKYFYLEAGDVIRLNKILGEGKAYAFGEDYTQIQVRNGQYIYPAFYITKVKRRLDKNIEIEAMQMHYLNEDSSTSHGWQPPEVEPYAIYGCTDPDALNYNPMTTVEVTCLYRGDLDNSGRIDWVDVALLQFAIADNDIALEAPGTPLYNQMDVDEDSIVSIKDVWKLMEGILLDADENNYGCMDGGNSGDGASWGNPVWPEAENYDPDAIIHDQDSCIYAQYVCGGTDPEPGAMNWCASDIDSPNYDYCMIVEDIQFTPENILGELSEMQLIGEHSFHIFQYNGGIGYQGPSGVLTPYGGGWDMQYNGITVDTGGGNTDVNIGCYYGEYHGGSDLEGDGPEFVSASGVHPHSYLMTDWWLSPHVDECPIDANSEHVSCACVLFVPITLRAGHKYLFYHQGEHPDDSPINGNSQDSNVGGYYHGTGYDYYVGSWHQHPIGIQSSEICGGDVNPVFQVAKFPGIRWGLPSPWPVSVGEEGGIWNEQYPDIRIFTAPSDATTIPGHPDIPGPLWSDAGYDSIMHKDSLRIGMEDGLGRKPFPYHTAQGFLDLQNSSQLSFEQQNIHLNKSWRDWHGGPSQLPYGTPYQTNFCLVYYNKRYSLEDDADDNSPHFFGFEDSQSVTNEYPFEGIKLLSLTSSFQDEGDDESGPGSLEADFFNNINNTLGSCIDSVLGPTEGDE